MQGGEGLQISYDDPSFPPPNSAYIIKKSCGSSLRSFSLGWCPQYGSASCDYQYADTVCKSVYGGQLATPRDQQEYDFIAGLVVQQLFPILDAGAAITGRQDALSA